MSSIARIPHSLHPSAPGGAEAKITAPIVLAGCAWLGAGGSALYWPDVSDWSRTELFALIACGVGSAILAALFVAYLLGRRLPGLEKRAPWLVAVGLGLTFWELASAKFRWAPPAFFPPPQELLEVYLDDFPRLGASLLASGRLLIGGFAIGASLGFVTGVSIGWSRRAGYWAHPLLRIVGPLPATAWAPVAFFAFPSSDSAAIFLVALAAGFPVTVLTWSGVASVPGSYYDVARTLGAGAWFLVLRVAIPAALSHVFVGLFMGLGASFAVLVVAELLGVKGGIGFYLQWAQGWASYGNVYAALIALTLLSSGAITLLFLVRDRLLSWQKGLVTW
jgi:NitT/TauT family transport system permease protein